MHLYRKEEQRSPKEELVNHSSGSRKHESGSRNEYTKFVPEWTLEQIMKCESWSKPHSTITSRDLRSTYIVFICFQNKYNQNIRRCDVGDDCDVDEADGGVVCF